MTERVYVELSDGRQGAYIVTEEHPDGSLVVVPDRSEKAGTHKGADEEMRPSTLRRRSGRSLPET